MLENIGMIDDLLSVGHHQNTVVTIVLQADKVFVKLTCLMKPHLKERIVVFTFYPKNWAMVL